MNLKVKVIILFACLITIFTNSSLSAQQFRAFLFTKTDGFHHESINEGVRAMKTLAARHNFSLSWNEDAAKLNDNDLRNFDVIIFLNTTENILNEEQQAAMERFIRAGKGFVGIHSASDTEYDWPWYNQLVGRMFHIHPQPQTAMLEVVDDNFPGMEVFPQRFMFTDEWYEFKKEVYSTDLQVLLSIDEDTYDTSVNWGNKSGEGMGAGHPISWYQYFDGGRSFYTALGHIPAVFEDPWFLRHVYGGIYWAATGKGIHKP